MRKSRRDHRNYLRSLTRRNRILPQQIRYAEWIILFVFELFVGIRVDRITARVCDYVATEAVSVITGDQSLVEGSFDVCGSVR